MWFYTFWNGFLIKIWDDKLLVKDNNYSLVCHYKSVSELFTTSWTSVTATLITSHGQIINWNILYNSEYIIFEIPCILLNIAAEYYILKLRIFKFDNKFQCVSSFWFTIFLLFEYKDCVLWYFIFYLFHLTSTFISYKHI